MRQDAGEVFIDGEPVYENARIKGHMAYIPDDMFYFLQSDTINMMHYYKGMYPGFDEKQFYRMQEFFPSIDVKRNIRKLSKGMQKQVAFWLALCCKPKLDLIRRSGCLIAAPSANTSGRPSPTEAAHVAEDLSGKIAMIIDGGPVGIGIESTIIDLTEDTPMVLRPGYITPQMLSKVLGKEVIVDPGIIAADDTRKPKAPGMKYKHYAPKADMVIVDGTRKHVIAKINELVASHRDDGKKIAVIATEETKQFYDADVVLSMGSRADEDSIAHELYRILRDCDELDVDVIFSESFSTPRIGQAIMNRMLKAAGHQVIDTHVKYDKIIFVAQTGTCREQMAKGIMNDFVLKVPMEIEARGLVVQFPEPVNQKAEAVLISNGISTEGMVSTQLEESDITESTMVFTMESSQRERIIESFADIDPEQVFVLSQYVGDELEILDPYGGTLQSYGLCYESLRATLKKLVKRLNANT